MQRICAWMKMEPPRRRATSVGMTMTAIRVEKPPRPIVVDHPFVFALRDEHTGTLLFIGAIRKLDNV